MPKHTPYYWIAEPLLEDPGAVEKRMFGCDAFYLHGRLMLVLGSGEEDPWRGILIPTGRESHAALLKDFPALERHSVLGKWLYLSEDKEQFEKAAEMIVKRILADDPRIGVVPENKRRKRRAKKAKR